MENRPLTDFKRGQQELDALGHNPTQGFRLLYDREVPFEIRINPNQSGVGQNTSYTDQRSNGIMSRMQNGNENQVASAMETLRVRIIASGGNMDKYMPQQQLYQNYSTSSSPPLNALRIELSSENDLYFFYTCVINNMGFLQLREDQRLMCDFGEFSNSLVRNFNNCIREPHHFLSVLIIEESGMNNSGPTGMDPAQCRGDIATLELIQNINFKFVDLLLLPFRKGNEDDIKAQLTSKYHSIRSQLNLVSEKYQELVNLVKKKAPHLLADG